MNVFVLALILFVGMVKLTDMIGELASREAWQNPH